MTPIAFFDENIAIHAHSASHSEHLKTISLKEFTQHSTERVSLYQVGDELYARKSNGDFIQGKEALDKYPMEALDANICSDSIAASHKQFLQACILAASQEDDLDSEAFNEAIAGIQKICGQDHGDLAGQFFSGIEDDWPKMSQHERTAQLEAYVDLERKQNVD